MNFLVYFPSFYKEMADENEERLEPFSATWYVESVPQACDLLQNERKPDQAEEEETSSCSCHAILKDAVLNENRGSKWKLWLCFC
jgi:hypothetical protein